MNVEKGTDWFLPFRDGNEAAFRHLFDRLYRPICYYAGSFLEDDMYSEDIACEAFHKAWKVRTRFASPEHLKRFLYTVTRNDCLNYLKSRKLKKTSFKESSHLLDIREDDSGMDLERAQADIVEAIYRELEALPGGHVLRMAFFEGKSNKDIAQELKITVENVYVIKSRALKALRGKLPPKTWLLFVLLFIRP